jgi:signal transduction histidine kinase/CheY-like chemotaxis protein
MRVTLAMATVALLLLLVTWLSFSALNTNAERFDRALSTLDRLAATESALHRDVLSARAGLLRNYDPVVDEVDALDGELEQLRAVAAIDAATAAAIDRMARSVARQEELVELFKSNNALLQNSLAYFDRSSARLSASNPSDPIAPAVSALAAGMLHLTLDTSTETAAKVQGLLDEVARNSSSSADADSVRALLAHARLLFELLPATDRTLKSLRALREDQDQEAVRSVVLKRQKLSRTTARKFRLLLYVASLLLIGGLVHLGLRLRSRARALQRHAAFEHVIAGVSMRFINARPQDLDAAIEQALAAMGECVGADRVYFLLAHPRLRSHSWHRTKAVRRPGWPEGALALPALFGPTPDGIVYVPHVNSLPAGKARDACIALGLQGWACAMNMSGEGVSVMLGFDALHRRCRIKRSGELGLLRMALDAILYAVQRQSMEQERVRLEARLQQGRRMEAVGALASGVAHNFNNIVGAILGYTEMAEAQVDPDSRPAHNLGEIRRAGERARDLVDQIMTFGRRRDSRRRPTDVRSLIAESAALLRASLQPATDLVVREAPSTAIVSAEPVQLQQVILNLCINAAQAMDGVGRVDVEAQVHDVDRPRMFSHGDIGPGRYVCIAVSDAGRGMDEATLRRIFEPFFTTRSGGNGLGLATVLEIVREHAGAMNVRSTPNVGSRFEAWLACIAAATPAPALRPPTLPLGGGETVLMIEDDREQRLRGEEILAALGYEPVGFARAEDAVASRLMASGRFDAIVIGGLPLLNSALACAASLRKAASDRPILMATASIDEIDANALIAAGIAEVVSRPLLATEIAAGLTRCLAARLTAASPVDR